jgi:hypothetical protein
MLRASIARRGGTMNEPLYRAESRIEVLDGLHRRAHLALGHTVDFGVHGAIRQHYKLSPPRELPLPVDYIVAATGG